MSSIPYSGGTIVNTTFTTTVGLRQEIVTALETQLTTAGWSVISGGGTGTVVMKSAVTAAPKSNSIRVRLLEVGSGNCAQVKIENDAGTLTSQAHYLLPAVLKSFRIIACKYNFFVFDATVSTARSVIAAGTLHIPTFLEGVVTADLGWIHGNGNSDTDVTIRPTFRSPTLTLTGASARNSQIRNNTLIDTNSQAAGSHTLKAPSCGGETSSNSCYRWSDDALVVTEAILGFGNTVSGDENKQQGIIHNAMLVSDSFAGDFTSISSYDGHAWFGVTESNVGASNRAKGTLFMAIS